MVEFEVEQNLNQEMMERIPAQRNYVNRLLARNKLKSYSLSADRSTLWAIFIADSEFEVMEMIEEMPLAEYLTPYISELMFHNSAEHVLHFSLN